MRYLTLVALIYFLLAACTDGEQILENVDLDFGYDYFPLEVGDYVIYEVDSIIYDPQESTVIVDTNSIQVREEVVDAFEGDDGQIFYKIERSERDSAGLTWQLTDVWSAHRTDRQAIRQEENLRFIKLLFPITGGSTWNANMNIDEGIDITIVGETLKMFQDWQTEVEAITPLDTINGMEFKDVATISLVNNENFIEYRFGQERYAKDIGLVYRELWILDTQNITDTLSWAEKAEKGFILKQQILEYN